MGTEKEREIRKFFRLSERIQTIKNRIDYLEREFYNQTFTPQTIVIESVEIIRAGFKMEREVTRHVDTINSLVKSIERLTKMKTYFDNYINDLPAETRIVLINKYINNKPISVNITSHEAELYEEIEEIYAAINFMYGFPVEIESVVVNNDNLEDEFTQILEALEV